MRVDLTPATLDLTPGVPQPVILTVTNTESIIAGFAIRILGADPGWVDLPTEHLSLFPDETRVVPITVDPPRAMPAGNRRLAVQVRELTEPYASIISEIDLAVPEAPMTQLRVDPMVVTAGKRASFSILVENTGNTELTGWLVGEDEESQVRFDFEPPRVELLPGQHAVIDMQAAAKRPFFGTPVVRSLSLFLEPNPPAAPGSPAPVADSTGFADNTGAAAEDEEVKVPLAGATFIQKSVMARGALSLLGLLFAATVFALVITLALSRLVAQSTADRNLALQVAAAKDAGAASTGTSGISGTVRQLTSGAAVPGVAVSVYDQSDLTEAVATTVTDPRGGYSVTELPAGSYKVSFRGAGFVQLWYPGAATSDDATAVTLDVGQNRGNLNVALGGVPASVSGTVVGDDVGAATLFLQTLPTGVAAASPSGIAPNVARAAPATPTTPVTPPDNGGAVVQQVPIGSDGSFSLTNVPSPSTYDLVVVKAGYATATQRVDVGAGESRKGISLRLVRGDGQITGRITDGTSGLGGVTITATSGTSSASTVSLTGARAGEFTLRTLATPASYTLVATRAGFASQTVSLSLASAQQLTGVDITMTRSSASLRGTVTLLPDGDPAPGVSVTFTNGRSTVQTVTESKDNIGSWSVAGLAIPGTYTATFARTDLQSQTISISLDSAGRVTQGSVGARVNGNGELTVEMQSSTAVLAGTVRQCNDGKCNSPRALGEATVSLSTGASTYTVTSASVPKRGAYRFENVPPGTYTLSTSTSSGTTPKSEVVTLAAGQTVENKLITLPAPASISGTVVCCTTGSEAVPGPRQGWSVFLYLRDEYPGNVRARVETGQNGSYSFDDVDAGTYVLAAGPTSDPASATNTVTITVQPSQARTGVRIVVNQ